MTGNFLSGRPNLVYVLLLVLSVCGGLSLPHLPKADYPELAPPIVDVITAYPGATPQVVAETVATAIEDQVNTVDNVLYFDSRCSDSGAYSLSVTFLPGTDPDMNLVKVQNAVKRAEPKLPAEVKQGGIDVAKSSSSASLSFLFSTDGKGVGLLELGNLVAKDIKDSLQRVEGVAQVWVSDREYAMRIWIDPIKMNALGLGVDEVRAAIAQQNIQPAAGFVGNDFSSEFLTYKINVRGRLVEADEFAKIVVRTDPKTGANVLLGDVARCELGAKTYSKEMRLDNRIAFSLQVCTDGQANAMEVARRCKAVADGWVRRLPKGVEYRVFQDGTEYAEAILLNMAKALALSAGVVIVLLLLFFGSWRTTLFAALGLGTTYMGSAIFLSLSGYTLDVFTLMGIVLVLGSLVFNMVACLSVREDGTRGVSAAILVGGLVSIAAYVPLAFHGGMVGMLYVRFAMTLCATVAVSSILTAFCLPVVAERMLPSRRGLGSRSLLARPIAWLRRIYLMSAGCLVRHPFCALAVTVASVAAAVIPASRLRAGFLPNEDRGYLKIDCELSEGGSIARTKRIVDRIYEALEGTPGVEMIQTEAGSSNLGKMGENYVAVDLRLAPFASRVDRGLTVDSVATDVAARLEKIPTARFTVMYLPAINGIGGFGGVIAFVCARTDVTPSEHAAIVDAYCEKLRALPQIKSVGSMFSASKPQLYFSVDRVKANALGVSPATLFATMQNELASFYVNDFNLAGGAHQVMVQNDFAARATVDDALGMRVPGRNGAMVTLSSVGRFDYTLGPCAIPRYEKMPAAAIIVTPAEGVSTLEVVDLMEKDPPDPSRFILKYSTMMLEANASRGRLEMLVGLALLFVYLVLVARFEHWLLPVAALIPSAFAVAGGILGLWLCDEPLTLYAKLGLVFLLEYPVRRSLLLLGAAEARLGEGGCPASAALRGAKRSFKTLCSSGVTFACAVLAMLLVRGVGAETLRSAGIAVCAGVAAEALLGNVFVPAAYVLARLKGKQGKEDMT